MTRKPNPARGTGLMMLVFAAALSAALSGCAGVRGEVPQAEVQPGVDCTRTDTAGRMPADFAAVALYRCDDNLQLDAPESGPSGLADRFEGDLEPVMALLAASDEPRWPGPCTAHAVIAPPIWFVDSSGAAVHITYPVDGCGQPRVDGVAAAIDRLDFVETSIGSAR